MHARWMGRTYRIADGSHPIAAEYKKKSNRGSIKVCGQAKRERKRERIAHHAGL